MKKKVEMIISDIEKLNKVYQNVEDIDVKRIRFCLLAIRAFALMGPEALEMITDILTTCTNAAEEAINEIINEKAKLN